MRTAPAVSSVTRTTSSSAFLSPPDIPWRSRKLAKSEDPLVKPIATGAERLLCCPVRPGDEAVQ
jgi:hypothetical protein